MDKKRRKTIKSPTVLYQQLQERENWLDKEIENLINQGVSTDLKPQMEALHRYNEIKDAAQLVLGYLADIEQKTIAELHLLFNLPLD